MMKLAAALLEVPVSQITLSQTRSLHHTRDFPKKSVDRMLREVAKDAAPVMYQLEDATVFIIPSTHQ